MDRRIILAVAGSGKTSFLIGRLDTIRQFLIVTYTDNNVANIRRAIVREFGFIPSNITLLSYFQFLIQICYRPFFKDQFKAQGILWETPNRETLNFKRNDLRFYMTKQRYLYYNRISKLCVQFGSASLIKERIERYYDCFMFDEIQDVSGHDFNFLLEIMPPSIDCLFVGDFYQHTFDTSLDGNVNCSLYDNYGQYKKKWMAAGMRVDVETLIKSYRCTSTICDFVTSKLGIEIGSNRMDNSDIIYITNEKEAQDLFANDSIVKLFYQDSSKYSCRGMNWGASNLNNSYRIQTLA